MKQEFENILFNWPNQCIRDIDLTILLSCSKDARYSLVKRALKNKNLILLKRGVYLIGKPYKRTPPNLFEAAQQLYGPSYISLQSALSYHQWIPEAVYTTTSVTVKRSNHFKTPLGEFSFSAIPSSNFYMGVERVVESNAVYLMADPWKALADYIYIYKPLWKTLSDVTMDLRIELEALKSVDKSTLNTLKVLTSNYPNNRVKKVLTLLQREL